MGTEAGSVDCDSCRGICIANLGSLPEAGVTGGNEGGENAGVRESIPGGLWGLLLGPVCPGKWPVSLARSLSTTPRLEPEEKRLIGQDQSSDWTEGPPAQRQGHGPLALQNTSTPPPRAKPPWSPSFCQYLMPYSTSHD